MTTTGRLVTLCEIDDQYNAVLPQTNAPQSETLITSLFRLGRFDLHSGQGTDFKIDCDGLSDEEIDALAYWGSKLVKFSHIVYVTSTRGGIDNGARIARSMIPFASKTGPTLIVDDVLTTGKSMWGLKKQLPDAVGLVLFSRIKPPDWIKAIFVMGD